MYSIYTVYCVCRGARTAEQQQRTRLHYPDILCAIIKNALMTVAHFRLQSTESMHSSVSYTTACIIHVHILYGVVRLVFIIMWCVPPVHIVATAVL